MTRYQTPNGGMCLAKGTTDLMQRRQNQSVTVLIGYRRNNKAEILNKRYIGNIAYILNIQLCVMLISAQAHRGAHRCIYILTAQWDMVGGAIRR